MKKELAVVGVIAAALAAVVLAVLWLQERDPLASVPVEALGGPQAPAPTAPPRPRSSTGC